MAPLERRDHYCAAFDKLRLLSLSKDARCRMPAVAVKPDCRVTAM
jgi:hypothetical protein